MTLRKVEDFFSWVYFLVLAAACVTGLVFWGQLAEMRQALSRLPPAALVGQVESNTDRIEALEGSAAEDKRQ